MKRLATQHQCLFFHIYLNPNDKGTCNIEIPMCNDKRIGATDNLGNYLSPLFFNFSLLCMRSSFDAVGCLAMYAACSFAAMLRSAFKKSS